MIDSLPNSSKSDASTITSVGVIFSKSINIFSNSNENNLDFSDKKIFSIYYWKKKRSKSSIYYYPSINNNIKNKAFISSFADSKYFSIGLIDSLFNSTVLLSLIHI